MSENNSPAVRPGNGAFRVLFVISSLGKGGAERALSSLLLRLPEDWDVDVLLNDEKEIVYPYRGRILSLGLPGERTLPRQLRAFVRRRRFLKKHGGDYDVRVSFMDSANFANLSVPGARTVVSVHTSLVRAAETSAAYRFLVCPLARLLYRRADRVVAVSGAGRRELCGRFGVREENCRVIYNGTDLPERRADCRAENRPPVLSTMGRLNQVKGQWHLLRVFRELHAQDPSLRLVLLGDGPLRDRYEAYVRENGLEGAVDFKGFVANPAEELLKTDLFVFPSLREGFPNALLEAMACGLPVVAADCETGPREILAPAGGEPCGVLVPVCGTELKTDGPLEGNEIRLLEAVRDLLADPEKRAEYGRRASARARDFSNDRMAEEWITLLLEGSERRNET